MSKTVLSHSRPRAPRYVGGGALVQPIKKCPRLTAVGGQALAVLARQSHPLNFDQLRGLVGYTERMHRFKKVIATLESGGLAEIRPAGVVITQTGRVRCPALATVQPKRDAGEDNVQAGDLRPEHVAVAVARGKIRTGAADLLAAPSLGSGIETRFSPLSPR